MTDRGSEGTNGEPRGNPSQEPRLAYAVEFAERIVYYGAALFLLITVCMVFYSAGTSLLSIREV